MKRLISILICILLLATCTAAYASEDSGLQILDYRMTDSALEVVLYAKANSPITKNDFSMKLGSTEIPTDSLSSYGGGKDGTTWILVLEPVEYANARTMARTLVEKVVAGLGGNDRLAVYNALNGENTEFMSSSASIMPAVDAALKESYGQIKLYDSIQDALSTFKTNPDLGSHKCLLVLSKGTDQGSNYTLREACDAAAKLPITVYTVGVTGQDSSRVNSFKELGALSRATESGLAVAGDQYTAEKGSSIAGQIADNEKNIFVLTAPYDKMPSEIPNSDTTMTVTLQKNGLKLDARMEHVDGAEISSVLDGIRKPSEPEPPEPEPAEPECEHKWKDATCTEPKSCELCGETDGEPLGHDFSQATFFAEGKCSRCDETVPSGFATLTKEKPVLVGMGALLLVLVIAVIVVLIIKKIKKPDNGNGDKHDDDEGSVTSIVKPKVTVELTEKKTGKKYTGNIVDTSIKAGLQSELRLEGDPGISRKHMEFIWQNGILYVQDINSKNGTFVNGDKIDKAVPLHHNDIIRAGETDFIVNWYTN